MPADHSFDFPVSTLLRASKRLYAALVDPTCGPGAMLTRVGCFLYWIILIVAVATGMQSASAVTPVPWPFLGSSDAFSAPPGLGDYITDIVRVPGGQNRLLFVGQGGNVVETTAEGVLDDTFLSLNLPTHGEEGLLGMEFSPNYPENPWVYCFEANGSGESRVVRYEVNTDLFVAIPSSEKVVLSIPRQNRTHVGGQIRFGADGYLYVAIGDDGQPGVISGDAQQLDNYHGKILRIDPEGASEGEDYRIPEDNPLVGENGALPEIIAWGLRNPWRFSFHPVTGALYIADVGENNFEEINVMPVEAIAAGLNFGWPYKEGSTARTGNPLPAEALTDPLYEYATEAAVIGGEFYEDSARTHPPVYIFGDQGGTIRALRTDGNGVPEVRIIATRQGVTCFGKDAEGRVLMASQFSSYQSTPIKKVIAATTVEAPIFLTPQGTRIGPAYIAISTNQFNVDVRCTSDGSEPTEESEILNRIGSDFYYRLEQPGTVRAKAFYPGLPPSATVQETYSLMVAPISAPDARLNDYTRISLTSFTPDVTIRYTTDGFPVTITSPVYDPLNPPEDLYIKSPTIVRAKAYQEGWTDSAEFYRSYSLKVSRPTVSFAGGDNEVTWLAPISLVSETSGAVIRYTTDGSTPDSGSPVYNGPIYLLPGMNLKAHAFKEGMEASFDLSPQPRAGRIPFRGTLFQITPSEAPSTASSGPTGSTPLDYPIHVARRGDGTLFVAEDIYSPALWKLSGGISTKLFQGQHSDNFIQLFMDFSGNLIVPRSTNVQVYSPPFGSTFVTEYVHTSEAMLPLATGGYLTAINRIEANSAYTATIYRTQAGSSLTTFATVGDQVLSMGHGSDSSILLSTGSRKILRLAQGTTETIAGSGFDSSDGWGETAGFTRPEHVISDNIGNIYVVDDPGSYSGFIRKITPQGDVSTAFGAYIGLGGQADGFGERFVGAGGVISVDDKGTIFGANGSYVWKFIQEDWDNDGIADDMEREIGAPWRVGRDDRFVTSVGTGKSLVAEFISKTPAIIGSTTVCRVGDDSLLIAGTLGHGVSARLECSHDGTTWFPIGPLRTATGLDIIEKVQILKSVPKRFYRFRVERP